MGWAGYRGRVLASLLLRVIVLALLVLIVDLATLFLLYVQRVLFARLLVVLLSMIVLHVPLDIFVVLPEWALFLLNFVVPGIFAPAMSAFQIPQSSYARKVSSVRKVLLLLQHASLAESIN